MAYSIINVSRRKPKTYDHLTRLQEYIEKTDKTSHRGDEPTAWTAAKEDLQHSMTSGNYERWIAPLQAREDGDRLILGAATELDRQWLDVKLDRLIRDSLGRTGHDDLTPHYEVAVPPTSRDPHAPRILTSRDDWAAYARQHLAERHLTPRQGKESTRYNSPLANHYTLTTSPQWPKEHPDQTEAWIQHSFGFFEHLHGRAQILGAVVHEHQSTLHLHVVAIPIDPQTGRLSASAFTRTPAQLEALHTAYNRYLRERGLQLERGTNYRLDRAMAAASPEAQLMALHADDIPLDEVLERLEADRDGRDPRRWFIGDRLIQVHEDHHGFTELGPHGANDGHGAIDLVIRLRQEGQTPLEEHGLAVGYLAALHPEHIPGGAPPLVPPVPEPAVRLPRDPQSMPFGQVSRWEPGQFIIVDSLPEAVKTMGAAKGWGRIAVAESPEALPVDELDEAVAKGWMVDVASHSDTLWQAVQERYSDLTEDHGRQVWRSPAPSTAKAKAADKAMDMDIEKGPDIGPEMMMGL